jgi:hypothetical protein
VAAAGYTPLHWAGLGWMLAAIVLSTVVAWRMRA